MNVILGLPGGVLLSNKGLNLPHASLDIPALAEKDREDSKFALEEQVDGVTLSFVRTAEEVLELRALIREVSALGRPTSVIAKIEKPEAMDNIDSLGVPVVGTPESPTCWGGMALCPNKFGSPEHFSRQFPMSHSIDAILPMRQLAHVEE